MSESGGHSQRSPKGVLTIHGAASDRAWQRSIQNVLEPHFECVPYQFEGYDGWRGIFRVVLDLPTLLLAIAALCAGIFLPVSIYSVAMFLSFGLLLGLSIFLASLKRFRASESFKIFVRKQFPSVPPHVIAHSFGTFLFGAVVERFFDVRFDNVILVSTVLPTNYPWAEILRRNPTVVHNLRSEFGLRDLLNRAATVAGLVVRDLGGAGYLGFDLDDAHVHTLNSPLLPCVLCTQRISKAKVHNVPFGNFGHRREFFLGDGHSRVLWLPFLWGIPIEDFNEIVWVCCQACQLESDGLYAEATAMIEELWRKPFPWLGERRTLNDYASYVIDVTLRLRRRSVAPVARASIFEDVKMFVHAAIEAAARECAKASGTVDAATARKLNPRLAIGAATRRIIG